MSSTEPSPASAAGDLHPGPLAWAVIVAGWTLMGVATVGAFTDARLGDVSSWATWVVGAAVIHDLVVVPAVLASGWVLTRWVPVSWRVPLRTALVVSSLVALTVWPIARRWGARADNPSILPLPVERNLAVIVASLLVAAVGVGAVRAWRARGAERTPSEDLT